MFVGDVRMTEQSNNQTNEKVQQLEDSVKEVVEEVDVVVSDRLDKLQHTLDTIIEKLTPVSHTSVETPVSDTSVHTDDAKELNLHVDQKPSDIGDSEKHATTKEKPGKYKRKLIRKYR